MLPSLINASTKARSTEGRITANGTYYFERLGLDVTRTFTFGAFKTGAGAGATVQLFREVAGVKDNLDGPLTVTNASPKSWPNEYTLSGKRGVVVTGLNDGDDILVLDLGQ